MAFGGTPIWRRLEVFLQMGHHTAAQGRGGVKYWFSIMHEMCGVKVFSVRSEECFRSLSAAENIRRNLSPLALMCEGSDVESRLGPFVIQSRSCDWFWECSDGLMTLRLHVRGVRQYASDVIECNSFSVQMKPCERDNSSIYSLDCLCTVEKSLRTTDVNRNDPPDCYLLYLEKWKPCERSWNNPRRFSETRRESDESRPGVTRRRSAQFPAGLTVGPADLCHFSLLS